MKPSLHDILESLSRPEYSAALQGVRRGVEKESLRVNNDCSLASTKHPASLGSPLTHKWITTDYAESLMEFITPVRTEPKEVLEIMADIHRHVYRHISEELLWPVSMPCTIKKEDDIGLANYGASNVGKMKTVYRRGLKHRYGSMMQVISGVHYNFSMPDSFWPVLQQIMGDKQTRQDFISERYFGLIRNFLRMGWLVTYLYGASPAVDATFLKNSRSRLPLKSAGSASHYMPYATSLRMSELGYNATEQDSLNISYNSLQGFVSGLRRAAGRSNPVFELIGVKRQGKFRQLNTNTLQLEGELYAPIRPKRVTRADETLSEALQDRGVEYVEVRCLDVNPYVETGVSLDQMYFLDIFLTYCLLKGSPDFSVDQQRIAKKNHNKVATCGRDLSLELLDGEYSKTLKDWAEEIFSELTGVARLLDNAGGGSCHQAALNHQYQLLKNPELTLSHRLLKDMETLDMDINQLALHLARQHRQKLLENDYTQIQDDEFVREGIVSIQKQRKIEESEKIGFEEYLRLAFGETIVEPSSSKSLRKCLVREGTCGTGKTSDAHC